MLYLGILFYSLLMVFVTKKRENKQLFFISIIFYTLFLSLRFGQGTDYFNYKVIYLAIPDNFTNLIRRAYLNYNVEPLFYILNIFAKKSNFGFQFIIFLSSFISLVLLYFVIKDNSINSLFSFFILFCNYFFYFSNIIRQSLAMSIYVYGLIKYLNCRNKRNYYLCCFVCCMLHTASIITFFIPILIDRDFKFLTNIIYYCFFSFICIIGGLFIPKIGLKIVSLIIPRYGKYMALYKFNYFPIILRFIFSFIIILNKKKITTDRDKNLFNIYIINSLFYYCISSISILSRLTDFIMFIEIILVPNIFKINKKTKVSISFCIIFLLYSLLFVKDLVNAPDEDNYYDKSILNYPYITIFNKTHIKDVKEIRQKNSEKLIYEK